MDSELALMRSATHRLPRLRGAGRVGNQIIRFYQRKPRERVVVDVLGMKMDLNPSENVDSALLFFPQLYDPKEIGFICQHLVAGDCFLDLGANIGFYSLMASRVVGPTGRVLAVEADPFNFEMLERNLALNGVNNVDAVRVGLSDRSETLRLGISTTGNRGGNSFLSSSPEGVMVECLPLSQLLRDRGVTQVAGAKIDIEGFEMRVLSRFFEETERNLYPGFLVVEDWGISAGPNGGDLPGAPGDLLRLLRGRGYRLELSSKTNHVLSLARGPD
jgi:FkbM family methyltransferase